jgi:hypothetical protein
LSEPGSGLIWARASLANKAGAAQAAND